jgi:thiol:disulfide interchange protein
MFSNHKKNYSNEPVKKIDYYAGDSISIPLTELLKREIESGRKPVLFFTAPWCGPCQEFKHSLTQQLMKDALSDITLIQIDMDAEKEQISVKYNIHAIPFLIRINAKGEVITKIDGNAWDDTVESMADAMEVFQTETPPPSSK